MVSTAGLNQLSDKEFKLWEEADLKEIHSLVIKHDVWETAPLPDGKKTVGGRLLRDVKASGRFKSRYVCKGYTQIKNQDYFETFAPVTNLVTLRIFLFICAYFNLEVGSGDITTAYLNADIDEDIYMRCDSDLMYLLKLLKKKTTGNERQKVIRMIKALEKGDMLKLKRAIYGTRQAGRQWWIQIHTFLVGIGFKPNKAAPCFYTIVIDDDFVILILYVDDYALGATTKELLLKYWRLIRGRYTTTFCEEMTEFLNIAMSRDRTLRTFHMSQAKYIEALMATFDITIDSSIASPCTEGLRISPVEREDTTPQQLDYVANFPYRKLIGAILYVNMCTMPGISYIVSALAKFNQNPVFDACKELIRLCKYVYNDRHRGLTIGGTSKSIVAFSDADWAGEPTTRHSRSGSINFLGNSPISWYSKMQTDTALSTLQSEHNAMVPANQNNTYIKKVCNGAGLRRFRYRLATSVYCDNDAALAISTNPVMPPKAKHVHIKYQYVLEQFNRKAIKYGRVSSADNCADVFTKPIGRVIYLRHLPTITGTGKVEALNGREKTIDEDSLFCPRCECKLADSAKQGEY